MEPKIISGPAAVDGVLARVVLLEDGSARTEVLGADGWSAGKGLSVIEVEFGRPVSEADWLAGR